MNAKYILGLIQGDGSFHIKIHKKKKYLWLEPSFNLSLHKNNENTIKDIKNYFGIGYYRIDNKNICRYEVNSIKDIYNIIIPFFLEHKLKGEKYTSFLMFKIIITKLYHKEHYISNNYINNKNIRYSEILLNLINMTYKMNPINHNTNSRASLLNWFNLEERKIVESDLIYQKLLDDELQKYPNNENINIDYIQGLFDADGSLSIYLEYNRLKNLRFRMTFNITQDIYNKEVLELIQKYFKCGYIYKVENTYKYDVKSVKDIQKNIVSKFNIDWIEKNNTVRLNKIVNVIKIFNWLDMNKTATIKTNEDYEKILNYMYNINNINNQRLEEYVKYHIFNKPIKK